MALVRFDPFGVLRDVERMFEEYSPATGTRGPWVPRVDVFERENALVIRAEVPGMSADDVDVTVEDSTLVIAGARSLPEEQVTGYQRKEIFEGEFRRTLILPEGLETDQISASYRDGLLEVSIPKSPEVLPKKIQVKVER